MTPEGFCPPPQQNQNFCFFQFPVILPQLNFIFDKLSPKRCIMFWSSKLSNLVNSSTRFFAPPAPTKRNFFFWFPVILTHLNLSSLFWQIEFQKVYYVLIWWILQQGFCPPPTKLRPFFQFPAISRYFAMFEFMQFIFDKLSSKRCIVFWSSKFTNLVNFATRFWLFLP